MSKSQKTKTVSVEALAAAQDPDALLTLEVVCALTGLVAYSIQMMVKRGEFPAPIHINQRILRWVARDVRAWLRVKATPDPVAHAARLMGITLPLLSTSR